MTGGLYDAATLERWNVINRVLAPAELIPKATSFAGRLAAGPTLANAGTKRIVRAQADNGTQGADAVVPGIAAELFETEDLKGAVESFLTEGPGKAHFRGR
jgi:enoyl-CoA hydratase/carnithine racemase